MSTDKQLRESILVSVKCPKNPRDASQGLLHPYVWMKKALKIISFQLNLQEISNQKFVIGDDTATFATIFASTLATMSYDYKYISAHVTTFTINGQKLDLHTLQCDEKLQCN